MWMRYPLFLAVFLIGISAHAQPANDDCADAETLCAGQVLPGGNSGSLGGTGFCPGTSQPVWYSFTTNSVGGDATFSLNDLSCALAVGADNELSMVVLIGDGSCTVGSFTAVAPCAQDSLDQDYVVTGLLPDTVYWLVVSGVQDNGSTLPASCNFSVSMSGPGVDIVDVDFDAGPDFEIQNGETVQILATGPGPNWSWSPTVGLSGNNIPDPFANPNITTVYTLTETINDCVYSDTVVVDVIRLINAPNAFTPNGDSFNDTWEIEGINAYPNAEILVFDRWGQIVFSINGYSEEWDGTRNGKPLSTGTYYYHIKLNRISGQVPPITGSVSIIR